MKKIVLRFFRILLKLLLFAYVFAVNLAFVSVFYFLVWGIIESFIPMAMSRLSAAWHLPNGFLIFLPLFIVTVHALYCLSPLNLWVLRLREGYVPMQGKEKERIVRLIAEIDPALTLKLYHNDSDELNAAAFGLRSLAFTRGTLSQATNEELKGVICHELGHIRHGDFIYAQIIYSMETPGYYALYGIFWILTVFFKLLSLIVWIAPFCMIIIAFLIKSYRLLSTLVYRASLLANRNLNKYGEYRCDAYALKYGCGEGLLSFLSRLHRVEDHGSRPSFTEYLMSSHPATLKRIIRLQKRLSEGL